MTRYQKFEFYPNISGEFIIEERDGRQYVSGNFTINTTLVMDNVSKISYFYLSNKYQSGLKYSNTINIIIWAVRVTR